MENDKKVIQLEKQVEKLSAQIVELLRRVTYLERENNRRKSETSQIASHMKRN